MVGRETKMAERRLAELLAGKWKREYSEMVANVRARMALAVVREPIPYSFGAAGPGGSNNHLLTNVALG